MRINYFSPIRLTLALLPESSAQRRIVNISSWPRASTTRGGRVLRLEGRGHRVVESMMVDLGIAGSQCG